MTNTESALVASHAQQLASLQLRTTAVEGAIVPALTTTSGDPSDGPSAPCIRIDPATGYLYVYDGEAWRKFTPSGTIYPV